MDAFLEDTVLVDAAVKCEACGRLVGVLLPASDGSSVCASCCQKHESDRETVTWNGLNPLDPAYAEETLPMDRSSNLQARVQVRLQN